MVEEQMFWTMISNVDSTYEIKNLINDQYYYDLQVFSISAVKPVVNLNKCALGDADEKCSKNINGNYCSQTIKKYKKYNVCDEIEYNGDKYYVIEESNDNNKSLKLLKVLPLSINEIYNKNNSNIGLVTYSMNLELKLLNDLRYIYVDWSYDNSIVKKIVDNWVTSELDANDLMEINGYKARLFNQDDFYYLDYENREIFYYDVDYWGMRNNNDDQYFFYDVYNKTVASRDRSEVFVREKAVRPVINLKKSKISNIQNLNIGDTVTYKDNDYYMIFISDDDYVTLLKKEALSQHQINLYFDQKILATYDNTLNYINEWSKKFNDDLIDVGGKKVGLISDYDLYENLGFAPCVIGTGREICRTDATPSCFNSDYWFWTSVRRESNASYTSVANLGIGPFVRYWTLDSNLAIRPVINLNKCVIEDGCYDEQVGDNCSITTEDEIDPPVKSTVVKIENTLKNNSYILIILGLLLITGGYIVYKYKFKKKNN